MARTLTVKTDASYKKGVGFSVAYKAEVFIGGEPTYEFSDSKYIERATKSTDAEVVGVAYGIVETYKNMGGRVEDYNLFLHSDCQHAVKVYQGEKEHEQKKLHRVLDQFLDKFFSWRIYQIPRENNTEADMLAKVERRKAEERKQ